MSQHISPRQRANEAVRNFQDEDLVEYFTDPCRFCGQGGLVRVFPRELRLWEAGAKVQDAFPTLSPEDRELLISGTHPKCWDEAMVTMFGPAEEDR